MMKKEDIEVAPMIRHLTEEYKLKSDKAIVFDVDISPEGHDHLCRSHAHQQCHQQPD